MHLLIGANVVIPTSYVQRFGSADDALIAYILHRLNRWVDHSELCDLPISEKRTAVALRRLIRAGMVEKSGNGYRVVPGAFNFPKRKEVRLTGGNNKDQNNE